MSKPIPRFAARPSKKQIMKAAKKIVTGKELNKGEVVRILLVFVIGLCVACAPKKGMTRAEGEVLEKEIARLEAMLADYRAGMQVLSDSLNDLTNAFQRLRGQVEEVDEVLLAELEQAVANLSAQQAQSEMNINNLVIQLAQLSGYTHIDEIIDPCGDTVGKYDEVLLRLSDGSIIASFSDSASGQNTRFALIPNGSYQTTDGTSCRFSVSNGVVSW